MQIFGYNAFPIWKDIILSTENTTFENFAAVDFEVQANLGPGDSVVSLMSGRAVKRPGDSYINVRVNDIISGCLKYTEYGFPEYGSPWEPLRQNETIDGVTYPVLPKYYGARLKTATPSYVWTPAGGAIWCGRAIPSAALAFKLIWSDPEGNQASETVNFAAFNDWSYDRDYDYDNPPSLHLSQPISYLIDNRQLILITMRKCGSLMLVQPTDFIFSPGTAVVTYPTAVWNMQGSNPTVFWSKVQGTPLTMLMPAALIPDHIKTTYPGYSPEHKAHYYFELSYDEYLSGSGHDNERFPRVKDLIVGETVNDYFAQPMFKIRCTEARYCLYYVNAYGGWDWFLILGKTAVSDDITREEYTRRGGTALIGNTEQRGREVLSEEIVKHLEAHTHWLNDDEASRMWHLTEATEVYIHDLETDAIYPAVMTGSSYEYKTYKNQGRRLISYQLDLDFAVTRERM